MSGDLLSIEPDEEDVDIEPDLEIEPEPDIETQPDTVGAPAPPAVTAMVSAALVELLPADFKLPLLTKFVPNQALRVAANEAATYAMGLVVEGADGVTRADLALTALRASLRTIEEHFDEPTSIANALHKRLTTVRSEWCAVGKDAVEKVGNRIYREQKRLEQLAADERRKAQDEADRQAREAARREAEEAAAARAPAPIVEELKRQAQTATAPPVSKSPFYDMPQLKGNSTVERWKARIAGTPGSDEPHPDMAGTSTPQRVQIFKLLQAILDGAAPLTAIELNWRYLDQRAKADKSTLAIAGIEAFEEGSVRSKPSRR